MRAPDPGLRSEVQHVRELAQAHDLRQNLLVVQVRIHHVPARPTTPRAAQSEAGGDADAQKNCEPRAVPRDTQQARGTAAAEGRLRWLSASSTVRADRVTLTLTTTHAAHGVVPK